MSIRDPEEQVIHDAFSQITVDTSELTAKVKTKLNAKKTRSLPHQIRGSVAIATVMSVMLVGTVAAAALGGLDWFIEKFNPAYGSIVEEVHGYAEDQDIRMEVIGAQKYDNMAVIYYSLQDMSGENRLTENTDFRDGFGTNININDPPSDYLEPTSSYSYNTRNDVLYFDKETNTVYYELVISGVSGGEIADPLTIGSFLIYFDTEDYQNEPSDVSLDNIEVSDTVSIKEQHIFGMSGDTELDELQSSITKALSFGFYADAPYDVDDMWISNIGMIDGKLHVQIGKLFNHEFGSGTPSLSLMSATGEILESDYTYDMLSDKNNAPMSIDDKNFNYDKVVCEYTEHVFSVDADNLNDYTLCFTGMVYSGVEGNWKVAAYLNDSSSQILVWSDVTVNNISFEYIELSPLGLQAKGIRWDTFEFDEISVSVETSDGIVALNNIEGYSFSTGNYNLSSSADEPIDISSVTAIVIYGIRIPVE